MRFIFRASLASAVAVLTVGFGAPAARAAETPSAEWKAAQAPNRLGYGPRPGEVSRVARFGVEN